MNNYIKFISIGIINILLIGSLTCMEEENLRIQMHHNSDTDLIDAINQKNMIGINQAFANLADPNTTNWSGLKWTPLFLAAIDNNASLEIITLLIHYGTNINAQDLTGRTVLHWLIQNNYANQATLLLSYGAKFDIKDTNNKTALDIALDIGNQHLIYNNPIAALAMLHDPAYVNPKKRKYAAM